MANIQQTIVEFLRRFAEPLEEVAESEQALSRLLRQQGWHPGAFPTADLQRIRDTIAAAVTAVRAVVDGQASADSLVDLLQWIQSVRSAVAGVEAIGDRFAALSPTAGGAAAAAADLLDLLLVRYLLENHEVLARSLQLLTLIEDAESGSNVVSQQGWMLRSKIRRPRVRFDRLKDLLSDPAQRLRSEYLGTDGLKTSASTLAVADRLFPRVGALVEALGGVSQYAADGVASDAVDRGTLAITIPLQADGPVPGAVMSLSADDADALGLVVAPFGALQVTKSAGPWQIAVTADAQVSGFAIGNNGLQLRSGSVVSGVDVSATATLPAAGNKPAFLLGSAKSTRLEIGDIALKGELHAKGSAVDYGFEWAGKQCAIVLKAGEGDGFLSKVLPSDPIRANFDLTLGWSTKKGLYLGGTAGVEITIPVHIDIGGVVNLDSVYLAIAATDAGLGLNLGITASAKLGPIAAAIKQVGIKTLTNFPGKGGNLGFADMTIGFLPPTGAGLSLDAGAVLGAGYVERRPGGEYGGIVNVAFSNLAIIGQGLIKPSADDFSMVIIVSVIFPTPIQLSWGFTLSGVGGLVAVNRTMNTEFLREGLKSGALDALLFPEDPVANGPMILNTMGTAFPDRPGRFVVGPIFRIGWGTPNLIIADIGVMIEVPEPVRLVLIGQISALLPKPDDPVLELHLDVLGVLDFEAQQLSIDATIYNSKFLTYRLYGDSALRWNWGDKPQFALSVGGFHPKYAPPPRFPSLRRLTLNVYDTDNLQLDYKLYLALTSNTVQFGARVELYASVSVASIEGEVGFDGLIQVSPFHFDIDMSGHVSAEAYHRTISSVKVHASVSGPTPWHVRGEASFHVLRWDPSVDFNKSWGRDDDASVPKADPRPPLLNALKLPDAWGAAFPGNERPVETLAPPEEANPPADRTLIPVRINPAAELQVLQSVLPFEFTLERFGSGRPKNYDRFAVSAVHLGGVATPTAPVETEFARSQYEAMSQSSKLSGTSFISLQAGREISPRVRTGAAAPAYDIRYEQRIILADGTSPPEPAAPGTLAGRDLRLIMEKIAGKRRRALPPGLQRVLPGDPKVKVKEPGYGVVDPVDLRAKPGTAGALSYSAAKAALKANPGATMVPAFEVRP